MGRPLPSFGLELELAGVAGATLRALRLCEGLSQHHVSSRTGIARPIVARIERGQHCPSLHSCDRFARACGGSLRDVLGAIDAHLGLRAAPKWRSNSSGRRVAARVKGNARMMADRVPKIETVLEFGQFTPDALTVERELRVPQPCFLCGVATASLEVLCKGDPNVFWLHSLKVAGVEQLTNPDAGFPIGVLLGSGWGELARIALRPLTVVTFGVRWHPPQGWKRSQELRLRLRCPVIS